MTESWKRNVCHVTFVNLLVLCSLIVSAQTSAGKQSSAELRIRPSHLIKGVPDTISFVFVNIGDHELRIPPVSPCINDLIRGSSKKDSHFCTLKTLRYTVTSVTLDISTMEAGGTANRLRRQERRGNLLRSMKLVSFPASAMPLFIPPGSQHVAQAIASRNNVASCAFVAQLVCLHNAVNAMKHSTAPPITTS